MKLIIPNMKNAFFLLLSFYLVTLCNAFVSAKNAKSSTSHMIQMALGPLGAVSKLVNLIFILNHTYI